MVIELPHAVGLLNQGSVVAIPTETVYGLAARIDCPEAIDKIYRLKKRPQNNPLIIHFSSIDQISRFLDSGYLQLPAFKRLSLSFWPGPLTLILPVFQQSISTIIRAGLSTAAFRFPAHSLTQDLLNQTGPLVAPSANLSGRPSSTEKEHVEADFGSDFPILGGQRCEGGIESSIVGMHHDHIVLMRKGALSQKVIEKALGYPLAGKVNDHQVLCPGRQHLHYAPLAKLTADCSRLSEIDAVIGFDDRSYSISKSCHFFSLGTIADDLSAAFALYSTLRSVDEKGCSEAFVDLNLPDWGLWPSISDRLSRAIDR